MDLDYNMEDTDITTHSTSSVSGVQVPHVHVAKITTLKYGYNLRIDMREPKNEIFKNTLSCFVEFWVDDLTNQTLYSRLLHRTFVSILDLTKVNAISINITILYYRDKDIYELLKSVYELILKTLTDYSELVIHPNAKFYKIESLVNNEIYATMDETNIYSLVKLCDKPIEMKELKDVLKSYIPIQ